MATQRESTPQISLLEYDSERQRDATASMTPMALAPALDAPVRPPLKWAGGKRWQLPHLIPLWKDHTTRRLIEPFCGGLAVTLGLQPERAILNDANPHLISFYRWMRRGLHIEIRLENDETLYYKHRKRFNQLLSTGGGDSQEAASLFYYLNRTGYNGLCRFNRRGLFNVPFGSYARISYTRDFSEFRNVFEAWDFVVGDFENVDMAADDFIYADPPYDVEFTHYSSGGFSWQDQQRTAEWLVGHPGPVILVNQATPRVVQLYKRLKYEIRLLNAPRRISCTGDRTPAREVLAVRNL